MNRRCALLPISDPGLRCKLFDSLVLPILSYASEVWAVNDKIGDTAELLHRQFLKHLLGVRDSTANVTVLAELGRFPLCFHWWQQICEIISASTICLTMNVSSSVPLLRACMIQHTIFEAIKFTLGSTVNL